MRLKKYSSNKEYVKEQVALSEQKKGNVFIKDYEIKALTRLVKSFVPEATFGICHGARNGWEVAQLRKRLGFNIIGTEISSYAEKIQNLICWDFHDVKPEWVGRVDFIYSNSLDHSHNPKNCLGNWVSCLTPRGICVVSWTIRHSGDAAGADCFSATKVEYRKLISLAGRLVKEVSLKDVRDTTLFVIKR